MSHPAVGVLGGTFNPVHVGHLRGALDCRDMLGLSAIRLIPAALPPLKATPGVSAAHRANMLDLAIIGTEGLSVDRRELDREGLSYTVDTLRELRQELGAEVAIVFIMGADSLQRLNRWHEWRVLLEFKYCRFSSAPWGSSTASRAAKLAGRTRSAAIATFKTDSGCGVEISSAGFRRFIIRYSAWD